LEQELNQVSQWNERKSKAEKEEE
jgi:hypothetical protein